LEQHLVDLRLDKGITVRPSKLHRGGLEIGKTATQLYDAVLGSVDVMVMPTVPMPALPFAATSGPLASLSYPLGVLSNTAQFNSTGDRCFGLEH
jgi:Asp-tRNA(Asn)/Glu-tRNA(Gln) amidotransferase A subunit family amidase